MTEKTTRPGMGKPEKVIVMDQGVDVTQEVFGRYENCTMGPDGRWYSDLDFINGELQPGSIPASIYDDDVAPYQPSIMDRLKRFLGV